MTVAGAVATISVAETTRNVATTPPIVVFVAPVNAVPVIVTLVPIAPCRGAKDFIVGAAAKAGAAAKHRNTTRTDRIGDRMNPSTLTRH